MASSSALVHVVRRLLADRKFAEAERLALQATQQSPGDSQGWALQGDVLRAAGKAALAGSAYRQALELAPGDFGVQYRLGLVLAETGQTPAAIECWRRVLALQPDHGEALLQLGALLAQVGHVEEGLAFLQRAAQVRPAAAQVRHNLGVALAQAGRRHEARAELERAVQQDRSYAAAWASLGNVLADLDEHEPALEAYHQSLALRPLQPWVCSSLALSLLRQGRAAAAVVAAQQATRLSPQTPEFHNHLGLALTDLGRFAEAVQAYQEALRLKPGYADAHNNMGGVRKEMGCDLEALACYEMAAWLEPTQASTHYNRSLVLLRMGCWEEGWPAYEQRWARKSTPERRFDRPRWDGSALGGQTILVWTEQGLGDALLFLRYVPLLQARGARTVVEVPAYLVPLVSTLPGVDRLVAEGEALPPFDCHVPILSLPGAFGTTIRNVPAQVPYLAADATRVARWRAKLGEAAAFRIGVVWQGNPYFSGDRWRSAPLAALAPLAEIPGVELISLQKNFGLEQLEAPTVRFPLRAWTDELDVTGGGFLDTAALLQCLDLVVCVDTAVGHLAGALGVPTWLALSPVSDWRWLRDRDDTPWYPRHRLFRQQKLGDWSEVFASMARELCGLLNHAGRAAVWLTAGELLDRLTRLRVHGAHGADSAEARRIQGELVELERASAANSWSGAALGDLMWRLRAVHERRREIEASLLRSDEAAADDRAVAAWAREIVRLDREREEIKTAIGERLEVGPAAGQKRVFLGN